MRSISPSATLFQNWAFRSFLAAYVAAFLTVIGFAAAQRMDQARAEYPVRSLTGTPAGLLLIADAGTHHGSTLTMPNGRRISVKLADARLIDEASRTYLLTLLPVQQGLAESYPITVLTQARADAGPLTRA